MPKHPSARRRSRHRLVVLAVACCVQAHAHADDMPNTLPNDVGKTRLLDEEAERTREDSDDLPATLPSDDIVQQSSESSTLPIRFEASMNAALSAPLGKNPDMAGFGFAVTYGAGWGEIPLAIGIDFVSVGSIGDASSKVEIELQDRAQTAERVVNTRLLHFDAWLRLQPAHFWVRPYAEAFFGAQLFQGRYLLRAANQESERAQADGWGKNLGWGLGVEFPDLLGSTGMSLTLGVRRVYADKVEVSRPVVLANERVQARYAADTSVLLFMVGVGLHYELADPPRKDQLIGR